MKKIILLILMSFITFLGYSQHEDFEGAPATPDAAGVWALPTSTGQGLGNWLVSDNRPASIVRWRSKVGSLPVHSGVNAAYVDRENTGPGVLSEEWLITPQITVPTNGQLRFFTTQTIQGQTNPGTLYQIRVSSSANQGDLSSYTTILKEYTETELSTETADQLDYEEKAIDLTFTGPRYFAFVKVFTQPASSTSGDRWLVDDVRWIQRCDEPIVPLGITNLTGTGVTATWTMPASSTQTQFEVEYGLSGFVVGTGAGTSVLATTGTVNPRTKAITGLIEGTDYQFYVRSVCPDSNSIWVGPFNFSTPPAGSTCAAPIVVPLIPYSDTSNTTLYGNNVTSSSPGTTGCGTTGAFLGGNDVVYTYTPTTTGFLNIVMNPHGATNTGVFVYSSCANIGTNCNAGVGNANSNIRTIPALAVTAGTPIYIVVSSTTATPTFDYTLIIQQVTCPNPITGTADGIGTDSATLHWLNGTGSTANAWQVAVQTLGSDIPTGPGDAATGNLLTQVSGLTAATSYQFWVRADCGNGVYSIWSGPFFFNTSICNVADQCNYTFTMTDAGNNGWNGATMQVRQNNIVVATIGGTFTSGGGPVITTVGMCDGVDFDLFWNAGGTNAGQCRVTIKNSFGQTIYAMTTASAPLVGTSLYQGTVNCQEALCQVPTGVTVPAATINSHDATVTWTSSGNPTIGWGVYWVLAGGSPPIQGQTPMHIVNLPDPPSYQIPGLLADTDYDVYISSICNVTNGPSDWTPVKTFHTTPTCPKPINVNITELNDLSFTVNWTNVGAGTAWQVLVLPSPSSLPLPTTGWLDAATASLNINATNYPAIAASTQYDVYVRAICPGNDVGVAQDPITVQTKVCPAADQCNYIFTVSDSFGDGWNGGIIEVRQNGVVVATLTGPTDAQNQALINVIVPLCTGVPFDLNWAVAGGFPGEMRISVTNTFGQVLYNMNTASGNLAGTVIYSDGAADCLFPKCLPVSGVTVSTTITTATINWTPAINNTGWDIFVIPAPGVITPTSTPTYTNVSVTGPPYTFTTTIPLDPDTTYNFYVRGTCAVGNPGDPSTVVSATTLPTCPQPINLNTVGTFPDHGELYWDSTGPATSWWVVVQAPGGGAPTGNGATLPGACHALTLPTLANPFNTLTTGCQPVLVPGFYEYYVQSECTSTDSSHWSGPWNFYVTPGQVQCAAVETPNTESEIDFCPGNHCVDLAATFIDSKDTTSYSVLPVGFAPPFPFTGGTQLNIATDDIWGPVFTLPFNFCFFGTNYPAVQVGSNGVISFTTTYPPNVGGGCLWNTDPAVTVPNAAFPIKNAIYGVYQDIEPSISTAPLVHSINYQVLGVAPCRTFVVNFLNVAQFDCGVDVGLQTSQIVMYETSNIIEVYIKDRTSCTDWNEGSGVVGIQNAAGTIGYTPPGRNLGTWEAHNEAWRFTPNGASNVTFSWLKDNGLYSTDTNINVCFNETTTMTAQAIYTGCGGQITTKTKTVLLKINDIDVLPVPNITSCGCYTLPPLAVGHYFSQPNGVGPITDLQICSSQTVYIYAESNTVPVCTDEESFTVTIEELVAPVQPDLSDCTSITLPDLLAPFGYFSDQAGQNPIAAGPITTIGTQTIYIVGSTAFCSASSSFTATVGEVHAFDQPDLADCLSVTLPPLPAGQEYYAQTGGPNGGQPLASTTINSSQTIYIYAQSGVCTDESSFTVTINSTIVPTFNPIANMCVGTVPPALPLTSTNSITGTWSPAAIDTSAAGTTVYTFTPDGVISCAVPTTLSVTIDPPIVPAFNPIGDICLNALTIPQLPLTSTNGVSGTWSPAVIDVTVAGTACYTFTPDGAVPCAVPANLCVTVSAQILPTFTQIANICQNTAAPILPTISGNGVNGTWLPAAIDTSITGTVVYIFTPNITELCAIPTTMTVTVDPSTTPTFTQVLDMCQNDPAPPLLPLTSNNGVTGTWSPATIDTSIVGTTTYTFTPDAGQPCTATISINVTINAPVVPNFTALTICAGDTPPVLAGTSPNSVIGTWSPAVIDNTASNCYVFTPNAGQCALPQTICVTVNPVITPDFAQPAAFCEGTSAPILAATSPNGVTGTWAPAVVSNSQSGCYTFTPNAGQCAVTQQLCIVVNPKIVPVFNTIPAICSGTTAPALQNPSNNSITGTWSPAAIDNVTIGATTYTFTPDPGQGCATTQTITVNVSDIPVFSLIQGCQEDLSYQVKVVPGNFRPEDVTYSWTLDNAPLTPETQAITVTQTGSYAATVKIGNCPATEPISVTTISCDIQRGISPRGTSDGDGLNDYFDLRGLNVKKLEIFNRYGTKVYSKEGYTKEWYGQSDKGNELPDGTYFYVIERSGVDNVTGWIYINREQ